MDLQETIKHAVEGDKLTLEMATNRFTYDLVDVVKSLHPLDEICKYNTVEINLEQVKMIDSCSIGFLFELNDKLKQEKTDFTLVLKVGRNTLLKQLFHKFQVDMLINIK